MTTLNDLLPVSEKSIRRKYKRYEKAWEAFADESFDSCHNSDSNNPSCGSGHFLGCQDCRAMGDRAEDWANYRCNQAIDMVLEDNARKARTLDSFRRAIIDAYQNRRGIFSMMFDMEATTRRWHV